MIQLDADASTAGWQSVQRAVVDSSDDIEERQVAELDAYGHNA